MDKSSDLVFVELSEDDINLAFDESWFYLSYQPIFRFDNTQVVIGIEAFARLKHPLAGEMSPCTFIPIISRFGRS